MTDWCEVLLAGGLGRLYDMIPPSRWNIVAQVMHSQTICFVAAFIEIPGSPADRLHRGRSYPLWHTS